MRSVRTALMMFLVIGGLMLLPTLFLPLGLLMIWCGWWVYEKMPNTASVVAAEERFTAVLMVLAGVGAMVAIVSYFLGNGAFTLPSGG